MPRYKLTEAREAKELGKVEFAALLGCEYKSVGRWEQGLQTPSMKMCRKIREVLENNDPHLFDNLPEVVSSESETQTLETCLDMPTGDRLDSSDSPTTLIPEFEEETDMDRQRRKLNTTIATGVIVASTGMAVVNSTQIITAPIVEADEYLELARTAIPVWWQWLNTGNYLELERALSKHVPTLKRIATTISPFQKEAAGLAVEAKIMQVNLASRNLQFSDRVNCCISAVQFGVLSGDKNLLALAQYWYGDTYSYSFLQSHQQPQTAIGHLNDALTTLGNESSPSLLRSAIYNSLSIAHAQDRDKTRAKENEKHSRDYAELARSTMPSYPELDPLYESIGIGASELDQDEGWTYLHLAKQSNNKDYAQMAGVLFDTSISKQAVSKGKSVLSTIRKADVSLVLGDKDECIDNLTNGYTIGAKIGSLNRLTQVHDILHSVPDKWQRETDIQELQKEVSRALVVARG